MADSKGSSLDMAKLCGLDRSPQDTEIVGTVKSVEKGPNKGGKKMQRVRMKTEGSGSEALVDFADDLDHGKLSDLKKGKKYVFQVREHRDLMNRFSSKRSNRFIATGTPVEAGGKNTMRFSQNRFGSRFGGGGNSGNNSSSSFSGR